MKYGKAIALLLLVFVLGLLLFMRRSDPTDSTPPTPEVTESETTPLVFATPPVELKEVLSSEQLRELDCSALRRLDLTGSTCYDEIESFVAAHPDVEVIYSVIVNGDGEPLQLDPNTESLTIEDASLLPSLTENVKWLPRLKTVSIATDAAEAAAVDALKEAMPDCEITYYMTLLGAEHPYDIEELTLTGLDADKLQQLLPELRKFTHLNNLSVPHEQNDISLEDALLLSDENELIHLDYQIELFGQTVSLDTESMEFENQSIGNDGLVELRAILPYFRNLKYLKLDSCDVDNQHMEQLRDDFPEIKVVWRVFFGSYHCLTDTEMIWATGGSVNDTTSGVLKYCTDVKYMDLGHTLITRVDFLNYMPKLEVLIIAISWVENIEPIANCPNLEYLEMFSARVSDLSPLAACTHLQHLNIGSQRNSNNVAVGPTDIRSLYDLPELKRFYCTMSFVPTDQQEEMISRHPDCEFEFRWVDPAEGYWRFIDGNPANNTAANRNERYALLCEQFGYDTYQQSGKTWSLYG